LYSNIDSTPLFIKLIDVFFRERNINLEEYEDEVIKFIKNKNFAVALIAGIRDLYEKYDNKYIDDIAQSKNESVIGPLLLTTTTIDEG